MRRLHERTNRLRLILFVLVLALPFLVPANSAFAQAGKGTITGRVTDQTGAVLQGAQVSLDPKGINVVSNVQGRFFINDLDPGSYTLTITYVGFESATKTVDVVAGQSANADTSLQVPSQTVEVLVTAARPSAEAEAVNIERTADNIVQVLPAEVIRSLPNANMADALGRLPSVTLERDEGEGKYVQIRGTEPRLTNTTIDGINVPSPESGVRQIKFDAIPADIVESVEINKTLQANMDGDGIGGSVNLVTKTAGQQPTINLSGMGGYTPIIGGRGLTETAGPSAGASALTKRLGVLVGGTYDWNGRGIDDVEPVADVATRPDGSTERYFESMDIREYRYYRSRWGLTGSADYQLGDNSNIYAARVVFGFQELWLPMGVLPDRQHAGNPVARFQRLRHEQIPGSRWHRARARRPSTTRSGVPTSRSEILPSAANTCVTTTWYSWDVAASRSTDTNVAPGQTSFSSTLSTSACQFDPAATTNVYQPQFTPACFTEAYNPANYELSRITNDHGHSCAGESAVRCSDGQALSAGFTPVDDRDRRKVSQCSQV